MHVVDEQQKKANSILYLTLFQLAPLVGLVDYGIYLPLVSFSVIVEIEGI